jgi:hypothetical protein
MLWPASNVWSCGLKVTVARIRSPAGMSFAAASPSR